MKKLFTFLLTWLCFGFTLGTLLLLGPLRMTVNYARKNLWSASSENKIVIVFIVLLAIVSAGIALLATNKIVDKKTPKNTRIALFGLPVLAIIFSIFVFMHPTWLNAETLVKDDTKQGAFSFGPYPEEEKMQQLKNDGFTGVISLLHPAIVPFEPALLEKEKKTSKEAGLKFVNIPLLPWISDNKESIERLRILAKTLKGKYYVHCYLGRDRVNAAMSILQQEVVGVEMPSTKLGEKDILNIKFERGPIVLLEKDVYLAPYPTKEEFFKVVGGVNQVVSLTDKKSPEAVVRTTEEQQWLSAYKMPFEAFDVNSTTSKEKMQAVINSIKKLPKPVFIHGFFPDDSAVVLFQTLYKANITL